MPAKVPEREKRSTEQLREQYEVEKELRTRLLGTSGVEERRDLYSSAYDELFRRVSHHPQKTKMADRATRRLTTERQKRVIDHFVGPGVVFLEVGAGDCSLSLAMAESAEKVYAVEVSEVIASASERHSNFHLILSDGTSIPVESGSVDLAYSFQLMEHLHPDDAKEQLTNVCRALKPGGRYICITPNRINGPWDISRYFAEEADGVHLKEYTNAELAALFRKTGFSGVRCYVRAKGLNTLLPLWPIRMVEWFLQVLPRGIRRPLSNSYPFRILLGINLVGIK